jgi:site-specific DNA recombinase
MIRVAIYTRVSDPSQVENNSLETQLKACQRYCKFKSWKVAKLFKDEGISAKHTYTRPGLRNLMKFCTLKKNAIDHVVVYKLDRWTRSVEEGLAAASLLAKHGVELKSATESLQPDATGRLLATVIMAVAEWDNNMKGERITDNMKALFKKGVWCWKPHIGYKRPYKTREENKGQPPIQNVKLAPILSELFDNTSTKLYSRTQLAEIMNKDGFEQFYGKPADYKMVTRIIKNTFYYGYMYSPTWDEYAWGIHEPLTDQDTWERANDALFAKKRKYKTQDSALYPLKGLVKCSECFSYMTSSNPKGRTKHYFHYECGNNKCRSKRVNIDVIHPQFLSDLRELKPSKDVLKIFEYMVFNEWDKTIKRAKSKAKQIETRIASLEEEFPSIRKARDEGYYTAEQAKKEASKLKTEITMLRIERSDHKIEQYDTEIVRSFTRKFLFSLDKLWERFDLPKKQALQNIIYPDGICHDGKEIRTTNLSPCFELIRALKNENANLVTHRVWNWNQIWSEFQTMYSLLNQAQNIQPKYLPIGYGT